MKKLITLFSVLLLLGGCCSIVSKKSTDVYRKGMDSNKELALSATIRIESHDKVEFILLAERLKENAEEYLPSSEDFRVEIISKKGVTLWNSNHNRSFLQTIGTVNPVTSGEKYSYKMTWDGRTNNRKKLPEGIYKVRLMIPSKPKAYLMETEIDWKGTDE